jgi:FkbM family methyltransferase
MSHLSLSKSLPVFHPNLRALRYTQFNSTIARAVLSVLYRPGSTYRVMFGPLRGLRMYYDQSINFHAILGLWEAEIFDILNTVFMKEGLLKDDAVIADVGANIGYYSMWFSTVLAPRGHVYSFEPSADIASIIKRNLSTNEIRNTEVIEVACGAEVGTADFFIAQHHHASSIHYDWASSGTGQVTAIRVPLTSLDAFFLSDARRTAPAFIKMDIEGGGTHALPGCRTILQTARPYLLIESHTVDEDRAISHVLTEYQYRAFRLNNRQWVTEPSATHPAKNGVWGTMLLTPDEHYLALARGIDRLR